MRPRHQLRIEASRAGIEIVELITTATRSVDRYRASRSHAVGVHIGEPVTSPVVPEVEIWCVGLREIRAAERVALMVADSEIDGWPPRRLISYGRVKDVQ